eukprot:jgi/Mesen1/10141/ME000076S09650
MASSSLLASSCALVQSCASNSIQRHFSHKHQVKTNLNVRAAHDLPGEFSVQHNSRRHKPTLKSDIWGKKTTTSRKGDLTIARPGRPSITLPTPGTARCVATEAPRRSPNGSSSTTLFHQIAERSAELEYKPREPRHGEAHQQTRQHQPVDYASTSQTTPAAVSERAARVAKQQRASSATGQGSTLGIPPTAPWGAPGFPQSPEELLQALTGQEARHALGNPLCAIHAAYAAARTTYFLGQGYVAARAINYQKDNGFFKNGVPANLQELMGFVTQDYAEVLGGIAELHRRDAENVRRGYYRAPYDMSLRHRQWSPLHLAQQAAKMLSFARDNEDRRNRHGWQEVRHTSEEARGSGCNGSGSGGSGFRYPEYYLQNFHFQDGWLSEFSADTYEVATETLFSGSQDAMQRGGLVPLHFFMRGRSQQSTHLLELACGTGRFLTFVKDNYPRLRTTAVDLSPHYLKKAQENMDYFVEFDKAENGDRGVTPTKFVQAAAENLPMPDASYDVVSCVYLFHELPAEVRREVVREMARVLKPGGIVILTDSLQRVDRPSHDFEIFPGDYHEPYYLEYADADLAELFASEAGMRLESSSVQHLSKTLCFRK